MVNADNLEGPIKTKNGGDNLQRHGPEETTVPLVLFLFSELYCVYHLSCVFLSVRWFDRIPTIPFTFIPYICSFPFPEIIR